MSKNSIVTGFHGSVINFDDIKNSKIVLDDIFMRLANINRFNGGTLKPYSVAHHSFAMQQLLLRRRGSSYRTQFLALLHDMAEAFVGDIVRPLKHRLPTFSDMEDVLFYVICRDLGVINDFTFEELSTVYNVDKTMSLVEWYVLNGNDFRDQAGAWEAEFGPIDVDAFDGIYGDYIDVINDALESVSIERRFANMWRTLKAQVEADYE